MHRESFQHALRTIISDELVPQTSEIIFFAQLPYVRCRRPHCSNVEVRDLNRLSGRKHDEH